MIIACPECSNPFEIEAQRIAPLVQIACPHCQFMMILDFEAANNPALVEEGMQMASGWMSAADYHTATTAPARPTLTPVPEPEVEDEVEVEPEYEPEPEPEPTVEVEVEVEPEPEPEPEPQVAARVSPTTPAPHPVAAPPTPRMPAVAEDEPAAAPPAEPEPRVVETPPSPARASLQIQLDESMEEDEVVTTIRSDLAPPVSTPVPSRPAIEADEPPTTPVSVRRPAAQATPVVAPADFDDKPTSIATVDTRQPPHSPPPPDRGGTVVGPAPSRPAAEAPRPAPEPRVATAATAEPEAPTRADSPRPKPRFETFDEPVVDAPKSSAFATVMVALLLLLALGLVGASLALRGTPDPRPLLEDLYRQYLK